MNKQLTPHLLIIATLIGLATALMVFSQSLPEDDTQVVNVPVDASASDSPSAPPGSAQPSTTPKPVETPASAPAPTPTPLPSFGIAATTPEEVLREAQVEAGRIDPFRSLVPPDLPEFEGELTSVTLPVPLPSMGTTMAPATLKVREPMIVDPTTPPKPRQPVDIGEGIVLRGIINGGTDPVAIVEVDGNSELVRVGDYLRGNILVTAIHSDKKYVNLSRGAEQARLLFEEEE